MSEPARIGRLDLATGSVETVVDKWAGSPLNSPNDVVVRGDGTVWFTDPTYGYLQGFRPAPRLGDFVYRHFLPGRRQLLTPAAVRLLCMGRRADIGKAERELGYRPGSIREAVREAYDWFVARGTIARPPTSRRPRRLPRGATPCAMSSRARRCPPRTSAS